MTSSSLSMEMYTVNSLSRRKIVKSPLVKAEEDIVSSIQRQRNKVHLELLPRAKLVYQKCAILMFPPFGVHENGEKLAMSFGLNVFANVVCRFIPVTPSILTKSCLLALLAVPCGLVATSGANGGVQLVAARLILQQMICYYLQRLFLSIAISDRVNNGLVQSKSDLYVFIFVDSIARLASRFLCSFIATSNDMSMEMGMSFFLAVFTRVLCSFL